MKSCKFKGCPRCKGDLFVDRDYWQVWYEYCLQCGFQRDYQDDATEQETRNKKKLPWNMNEVKSPSTIAIRTRKKATRRSKKSKK